jgi:hypothetical protein
MRPYGEPDRPHLPEDDDPNLLPWNRLRGLQPLGGIMPRIGGGSWQGTIGCAALLVLAMLIAWALVALGVLHWT